MIDMQNKWQVLLWAGAALVAGMTTWFSATAVLPELIQRFGLTQATSGWLTNAVQLGFVCGALVASALSLPDIIRPSRYAAVSAVLAAIANAALLLDISASGAILSRFATGVALSGVYPPALKFIATWFIQSRGLAMGLMVGALTLGSAMPHLVRSLDIGVSWQPVIIVSSALSLVTAVIFGLILKEGPHDFPKTRFDPRQIAQVVRDKRVMLANCGYFGHMWELYAMWAWFFSFATVAPAITAAGWSPSVITFAVIGSGAVGCVLAGQISDRIGRAKTAAGCMMISGACALGIGFAFDAAAPLFLIIALIWGLTIVADSAQFSAAVSELAERSLVGTALTFQMGVGFAITVLSVWMIPSVVVPLIGWQWAFAVLAIGPFFGCLALMRLENHAD